jgi:uncharacterized protein YaaW (UPF0174 family)
MGDDRKLSADDLATAVSTLIDEATRQQDVSKELLCQLETARNTLQRGITELTRDMPNKIARQAAQEVVQGVADSITRSVADVLRPAEAKAQTLLSAMEQAAATYRRAARHAVVTCIIFACLSGSVSAILVVFAMKMAGIV